MGVTIVRVQSLPSILLIERTYDFLNPQDEGFISDYEKFKTRTFELDRKLGAVLGRSFDDCLVTESIFKLLHIFGTLIQRPLIAQELNERMPTLVTMLSQEMEEARIIYNKQMQRYYQANKAKAAMGQPVFTIPQHLIENLELDKDVTSVFG